MHPCVRKAFIVERKGYIRLGVRYQYDWFKEVEVVTEGDRKVVRLDRKLNLDDWSEKKRGVRQKIAKQLHVKLAVLKQPGWEGFPNEAEHVEVAGAQSSLHDSL